MIHSNQLPIPNAVYGPSKAAASWYLVRINGEDEWLHSFGLSPGLVDTDLGTRGAEGLLDRGVDKAFIDSLMVTVETSCDGMMKVLAGTNKADHGGKLLLYTGEVTPW